MIITPTISGTFLAFQACRNAGPKVGFICEAESLGEAIDGNIEQVSKHCNVNNIHPERILEGVVQ